MTVPLTDTERADHLRSDAAKIVAAAASNMDRVVFPDPEWNVEQLIKHLGAHHRWVTDSIEAQDPDTVTEDVLDPDLAGRELLSWFTEGVEHLASLLESVPEDRPAWSWAGDHRKAFWARRTSVETTIHRWDVEKAVGALGPLDPALASDGIDEMATVIVPLSSAPYEGAPGTAYLLATDTGDEWSIDRGPEHAVTTRGASDADVRVAGTAEALLLFLWGRDPGSLEIGVKGPNGDDVLAWLSA